MNCIEREVDLYKSEREIIFSDSSLEDALLKSLEERQKAYEEYVPSLQSSFAYSLKTVVKKSYAYFNV